MDNLADDVRFQMIGRDHGVTLFRAYFTKRGNTFSMVTACTVTEFDGYALMSGNVIKLFRSMSHFDKDYTERIIVAEILTDMCANWEISELEVKE